MQKTIGIDIGATKTLFCLLGGKRVLKKEKIQTPTNKKKLIKALKKNIKNLSSSKTKIGIAVPGILDYKNGVILKCPNLKYLNNLNLKKELKANITIENDANCFTLAESFLGAGKNEKIVLGITLGSGIGGGLVIKDKNKIKIYRGAFGGAGEIGHLTIKFDGQKCSCGNLGCFECYGSAKFFKRKGYSSKELAEKTKKGDKKALKIFKEYGRYLGIGLSNAINLIDPEVIVIGGGISKSWPYFLAETKKEIKKRTFSPFSKKIIKVKISKLGKLAGAIGAGLITNL